MDSNNSTDQSAPAPAVVAPETQTPTPTQPDKPQKNPKYTRIILICVVAAVCLMICAIILIASAKPTEPTEPLSDNPPALNPPAPNEPEEPEEPSEDPVLNKQSGTDYAALEKTIIPARDDNGRIPDHVRGKTNSKVIVIEYADMQCPGCGAMMPRMTAVYQEYKDRVAFVFRHYPIKSHSKAMPAAIAAEAAGQQGYFWEMTEALYASQATWTNTPDSSLNSNFVSVFKQIAPKGNVEKFTKDLNNANLKTKIQFDAMLGGEYADIPGTPSIYVNGTLIDDFTTYDSYINTLKTKIDAELKK